MTKETCNIIRACKGSLHGPYEELNYISNVLERIKIYLSQEYQNDIQLYTDEQMEKIMYQAMGDYLDTCDKPSAFIYSMANLNKRHLPHDPPLSIAEKIAETFIWVKVKDNTGYINGFKQEFFDNRSDINV